MTIQELIERLEAAGFLFVTVVGEYDEYNALTAVDPSGFQVEIEHIGDLVVDRQIGAELWDIMFIGKESYL